MDDQPAELPANVKSRKPKKPKGWSYPLQTMEIVAGLDLGFCGADVDIDFNNSPQRPFQFGKAIKPSHSFDILRVICFGHLSLLANDGAPKFSIYTYLCLPQNRLKLSDAWLEIFPVIKQWMAGILNKPAEKQCRRDGAGKRAFPDVVHIGNFAIEMAPVALP